MDQINYLRTFRVLDRLSAKLILYGDKKSFDYLLEIANRLKWSDFNRWPYQFPTVSNSISGIRNDGTYHLIYIINKHFWRYQLGVINRSTFRSIERHYQKLISIVKKNQRYSECYFINCVC